MEASIHNQVAVEQKNRPSPRHRNFITSERVVAEGGEPLFYALITSVGDTQAIALVLTEPMTAKWPLIDALQLGQMLG